MTDIYVDGDACPVREEINRLAARLLSRTALERSGDQAVATERGYEPGKPGGRQENHFRGERMKVFVFGLLAYGEELEHLKVDGELPYPLEEAGFELSVP